jgi:polyisoprenoid-binding protein YceI
MTWRFGPLHSQVRWTCSYLGLLTVTGLFRDVHVTLGLAGSDVSGWFVEATIRAASIDSGSALRDEILRGADFLDAKRFPLIAFRSTSVERDGSHYRVVGKLTIHGVTREVALDLEDRGEVVDWLGQRSRVLVAETTLRRTDFEVGPPQAGAMVGPDVRISLQVELLRENDAAQPIGIHPRRDTVAAA